MQIYVEFLISLREIHRATEEQIFCLLPAVSQIFYLTTAPLSAPECSAFFRHSFHKPASIHRPLRIGAVTLQRVFLQTQSVETLCIFLTRFHTHLHISDLAFLEVVGINPMSVALNDTRAQEGLPRPSVATTSHATAIFYPAP